MNTTEQNSQDAQDGLIALGVQLHAIAETLSPPVVMKLGMGLTQELSYAIAAFKKRYPDYWPGGQRDLF